MRRVTNNFMKTRLQFFANKTPTLCNTWGKMLRLEVQFYCSSNCSYSRYCSAAAPWLYTSIRLLYETKVSHYEWVVLTILTRSMVMYCLSSTLAFPLESVASSTGARDRRCRGRTPTNAGSTVGTLRRRRRRTAAPLSPPVLEFNSDMNTPSQVL